MNKLSTVLKASVFKINFCLLTDHFFSQGLEILRNDLFDLYTAPRLPEPVWLSMMAHSNYKYVHCNKFMQLFTTLVDKFENKDTHL